MATKTAPRKTAAPKNKAAGPSLGQLSLATQDWFGRVFKAQSKEFYQLLSLIVFLTGFGLVMVLSASFVDALKDGENGFSIFIKQALSAIIGLFGLAVISTLRVTTIRNLIGPILAVGALAQLLVLFTGFGASGNGNRNWLNLGGFTIQPSEFLKIAMILFTAQLLFKREDEFDDPKRVWWRAMINGGVVMFLVVLGSDVGTVIVMAAILIGMLIMAGMPRRLITVIAGAAVVFVPIIMMSSASRRGRILAWLDPTAPDPNGYTWQSTHGIWAFASGGITGVGLGQSKLKWSWIPEAENDFIFAIIGEEMGLIGALVVIVLFVATAMVMIRIAAKCTNLYSRMVVLGVMLWITLQAMINIAVVLTLLPVLGVPLPLISQGGSSIIAILAGLGIVLGIERENHLNPGRATKVRR
jgi:cell division protein FtsW